MVLQVVVKDGRVLIGELLCIDKQANIILGNTYQQVQRYDSQSVGASHSRCLACVLLRCKSFAWVSSLPLTALCLRC